MNTSQINSTWNRSLQNVSMKRRKTGLMNYAKRMKKNIISKVEPESSPSANGLKLFQKSNSEDTPAYNNDANSIDINCSIIKPRNVNKSTSDVTEVTNRTIVKEEIDIKEESCDHLLLETTELNVTPDFSLSESNSCSNNANVNLITKELDKNQEIDLIPNNNVRIGIDESLCGNHVKGIFSSETIGSKTLIVFRRLPEEKESTIPKVVNKEESERSKRERTVVKLEMNWNKGLSFLHEQKKAILKGKYTRMCSKCKIPLELDPLVNCTLCAAQYVFSCNQCNETFDNHYTMSHHILMRCIPQGYYYCPQCVYKSRCLNIVHKHVLALHPHLGSDFDLRNIEWKDIARDENGVALLIHICRNCGRAFDKLSYYNSHAGLCNKVGFKSISAKEDMGSRDDKDPSSEDSGCIKKIVLHCEKCNKDTKVYRYINGQPLCIDCQSKLKFRCTLCNKLMDRDSFATRHLRLTCDSQTKIICKFCGKRFKYEFNLLKHEKRHLKTSKRQVKSLSKKKNLDEEENIPDNGKNKIDSNKSAMPTCEKEKRSSKCFSRQKSKLKISSKLDLTRQSKCREKKLQMQCKVLLTRLRIDKS